MSPGAPAFANSLTSLNLRPDSIVFCEAQQRDGAGRRRGPDRGGAIDRVCRSTAALPPSRLLMD